MATNAQIAAELLVNAANFFRSIGQKDPANKDNMIQNAATYEDCARRLVEDPMGETLLMSETSQNDNKKGAV